MPKRIFLVLLFMLLIPALVAHAQPPDPINSAIADLSQKVGRTLSITDLSNWTFTQDLYPDASLGCPQAGQVYAQVQTPGYQFSISYAGKTYDYRVSADRKLVVLCGTADAPTPAPGANCPPKDDAAFMLPRLKVGQSARVVQNGFPNNLRDQPGQSGKKLGEIPPGSVFTISDGPRCSLLDKIIWWQVTFNGITGWTGEGQAGTYWIEPLDAAGTPIVAVPTAAVGVPASRLTNSNVARLALQNNFNEQGGSVAYSTDGKLAAQANQDGTILVIDAHASGIIVRAFGNNTLGALTAVTFAPNNDTIATGGQDGTVRIWDLQANNSVRERVRLIGHTGAVNAVAFSPDGTLIASGGSDSTVRVWDANTGAVLATLTGHTTPVIRLTFAPDGISLLSVGSDGKARLWGLAAAVPAG